LKITAFAWVILLLCVYLSQNWIVFAGFGLVVAGFVYVNLPVILYHQLIEAHTWAENKKVRFWANATKLFNLVSFFKIPPIEIDFRLSCAEAREGNLPNALLRMNKYRGDEKVSKRIFGVYYTSIYWHAKEFDKVLEEREKSLREGNSYPEEMLDYAMCLTRRHKRTREAREVLEKVFDKEMNYLALMIIPYCQGVIEVEEGNFSQAEFYLQQAANEVEPFRKNSHLVGLISEIKAFLSITLASRGEKDEALKLFHQARPYLFAHQETELLRRCEEAVK
jgi:tetratricopeptide (TPR) repeat protein